MHQPDDAAKLPSTPVHGPPGRRTCSLHTSLAPDKVVDECFHWNLRVRTSTAQAPAGVQQSLSTAATFNEHVNCAKERTSMRQTLVRTDSGALFKQAYEDFQQAPEGAAPDCHSTESLADMSGPMHLDLQGCSNVEELLMKVLTPMRGWDLTCHNASNCDVRREKVQLPDRSWHMRCLQRQPTPQALRWSVDDSPTFDQRNMHTTSSLHDIIDLGSQGPAGLMCGQEDDLVAWHKTAAGDLLNPTIDTDLSWQLEQGSHSSPTIYSESPSGLACTGMMSQNAVAWGAAAEAFAATAALACQQAEAQLFSVAELHDAVLQPLAFETCPEMQMVLCVDLCSPPEGLTDQQAHMVPTVLSTSSGMHGFSTAASSCYAAYGKAAHAIARITSGPSDVPPHISRPHSSMHGSRACVSTLANALQHGTRDSTNNSMSKAMQCSGGVRTAAGLAHVRTASIDAEILPLQTDTTLLFDPSTNRHWRLGPAARDVQKRRQQQQQHGAQAGRKRQKRCYANAVHSGGGDCNSAKEDVGAFVCMHQEVSTMDNVTSSSTEGPAANATRKTSSIQPGQFAASTRLAKPLHNVAAGGGQVATTSKSRRSSIPAATKQSTSSGATITCGWGKSPVPLAAPLNHGGIMRSVVKEAAFSAGKHLQALYQAGLPSQNRLTAPAFALTRGPGLLQK